MLIKTSDQWASPLTRFDSINTRFKFTTRGYISKLIVGWDYVTRCPLFGRYRAWDVLEWVARPTTRHWPWSYDTNSQKNLLCFRKSTALNQVEKYRLVEKRGGHSTSLFVYYKDNIRSKFWIKRCLNCIALKFILFCPCCWRLLHLVLYWGVFYIH